MVDFPHKIRVPQRPPYLVPRPRLIVRLQLITERRLISVAASPGYGKTSLLIDFANTAASLPVCWYTLDRFDEDPWVFLAYLTAAVKERFPDAVHQTETLLASRSQVPFASAAASLIREVYALPDFVLIIDDWHIVDPVAETTELIQQLLLHCSNCHLILASRIIPSLRDLSLLMARRQMVGLTEQDLRFTGPEIAAVVGNEYQTLMSSDQAAAWSEQLNGWITGVLLAFPSTDVTSNSVPSLNIRSEPHIYQFFIEQVFDRQTSMVRSFLLDCSLLEELSVATCNEILDRTDSGELLDVLLRQHIFVNEISRGVLRFTPLFREFLQDHYQSRDPDGFRRITHRIANYYITLSHWALAFDLLIGIGDRAAAQQVVERGGETLYLAGRLETLDRWFTALPLDELTAPLLCLKARLVLDQGQHQKAHALSILAETRAHAGEEAIVRLLQAQLARISGRYEQGIDVAQQVLHTARLPEQRAAALRIMANCHQLLGQVSRAVEELNQALTIEQARGDLYKVAQLQHDIGFCYEDLGLLRTAEEYYSQADAYWSTIGNRGLQAMSLNSKGVVQHFAGRHRDAYTTLMTAVKYAQEGAVPQYEATCLTSLGDFACDLQLWTTAVTCYEEARHLARTARMRSYLALAYVQLLIRQHQYDVAQRMLQELDQATLSQYPSKVVLLQTQIACSVEHVGIAATQIETALATLEELNVSMDLARSHLLHANFIVRTTPSDHRALLKALDSAVTIADQLGHDTFLVIEAFQMRRLVRHAIAVGWSRAHDWRDRHHEMTLAAKRLDQSDTRPMLSVRTLGTDQLMLNGQLIDLGWTKAREVFYYLLAHPNETTGEVLREAIWPESSPERSRGALKAAIFQLRNALPRELIELHGRQFYRLNHTAARIDYDVERFLQQIDVRTDDPEVLLDALDVYRGPYLPGSDNQWIVPLRTYLEQRYMQALRATGEQCEEMGLYADALMIYYRMTDVDSFAESAHVGIMRCQIALGNRSAAIDQYRALCRLLDEELGLTPPRDSEIEHLYQEILNA